jgi:hypothetical protein
VPEQIIESRGRGELVFKPEINNRINKLYIIGNHSSIFAYKFLNQNRHREENRHTYNLLINLLKKLLKNYGMKDASVIRQYMDPK